ncbi:MAG TPA: cell division protein ZapA [Cytophagales bacterium]|jgi:cell division protein ZapA|nr:cell division protein ZapA [Cytophagales bacterium]
MKELSIKIKIADREYPMKVDANDEGLIRVAGKKINEKLKLYRDQFGIDDKQDLLAMVAFDNLFEKLRLDTSEETTGDTALEKITYLNRLISEELG